MWPTCAPAALFMAWGGRADAKLPGAHGKVA
jgi:hypothetical protein